MRISRITAAVAAALAAGFSLPGSAGSEAPRFVLKKKGIEIDLRSAERRVADEVARDGKRAVDDGRGPAPWFALSHEPRGRGGDVQVNDASLDTALSFDGTAPFVEYTQSGASVAGSGNNVVVGYTTSAGQPVRELYPGYRIFLFRQLSGYSVSNDGGRSWQTGFMRPVRGSFATFGDPSVAVDRSGAFYYASLGDGGIGVNRSSDGGVTWSEAVLLPDPFADKPRLAVGPDAAQRGRDAVYVTWTTFGVSGLQLMFARSSDGGATFSQRAIFSPAADPDPARPQNGLQFSNPVVDPATGALYVSFLQYSRADHDFVRILVSNDGGASFRFLSFGDAGDPADPTLLRVTQPGELIDCFGGGLALALHDGPAADGRFGLRTFAQASRLGFQTALAARDGTVYLAWGQSRSGIYGDPNAGSDVLFLRLDGRGRRSTAPLLVSHSLAGEVQHVMPALALGKAPNSVHVLYYTQHEDGTVSADLASSPNGGETFPDRRTLRVSAVPFELPPTNVPIAWSGGAVAETANYDRTLRQCYGLGDQLGLAATNAGLLAAWGDSRNTVEEPVDAMSPLSGELHSQQDVFFQPVKP